MGRARFELHRRSARWLPLPVVPSDLGARGVALEKAEAAAGDDAALGGNGRLMITPYQIAVPDEALEDLVARLQRTRWPAYPAGDGWSEGVDLDYLRDVVDYWIRRFDWRAVERELNTLPHYRLRVNDTDLHFLWRRGRDPSPVPLLLIHGWPGSFLEFLRVLPLLDAFDIVVPSLPGFAFSGYPRTGVNLFGIADLLAQLMKALGYRRFGVQGGDFGAGVATALGLEHAECLLGIHLNYIPGSYRPWLAETDTLDAAEREFLDEADRWAVAHGAYSHLQRTTPRTSAVPLNDSPAGLAAWLIEKFRTWSDCDGNVEARFSREELLTHVSLYWFTGTIGTANRLYYETARRPLHFQAGWRVRIPCGVLRMPKEAPFPPRRWVERGYDVARWTDAERGGHFAAWEEPEIFAGDVRVYFASRANRVRPPELECRT